MLIDIFELQRVNKWLETTRHLLRGVWIDDKDRPHLVVSGILAVAIFTHGLCFSVTSYLGQRLITPLAVLMWWREMAGEVEIGTRMRDHATSYYPWLRVRIMVTKQRK